MNKDLIPKYDKLFSLFSKIGMKHPVEYVLDFTGIVSLKSLKTACWMLRNNKLSRSKKAINLRFKFGFLSRVAIDD